MWVVEAGLRVESSGSHAGSCGRSCGRSRGVGPPSLVAEMMTVKEVAAALRVFTATVYALVNGGRLEHFRVLNAIRIPCDAGGALMKRKP